MLYNCAILTTAWIQPASVAGRKGRKNAEASQKMLGHQIEVPPNHARSDYVRFGVPPIAGNLHIIQTHSTTWFYYQYRAWRPKLDYQDYQCITGPTEYMWDFPTSKWNLVSIRRERASSVRFLTM